MIIFETMSRSTASVSGNNGSISKLHTGTVPTSYDQCVYVCFFFFTHSLTLHSPSSIVSMCFLPTLFFLLSVFPDDFIVGKRDPLWRDIAIVNAPMILHTSSSSSSNSNSRKETKIGGGRKERRRRLSQSVVLELEISDNKGATDLIPKKISCSVENFQWMKCSGNVCVCIGACIK